MYVNYIFLTKIYRFLINYHLLRHYRVLGSIYISSWESPPRLKGPLLYPPKMYLMPE